MGHQSVITASVDSFDVNLELFGQAPGDGAVGAAVFLIIVSLSHVLSDNKGLAQVCAGNGLISLTFQLITVLSASPLPLMMNPMTSAIAHGKLVYFLFSQWRPTRPRPCGSGACARAGPGTACAAGYGLASLPPVRHR